MHISEKEIRPDSYFFPHPAPKEGDFLAKLSLLKTLSLGEFFALLLLLEALPQERADPKDPGRGALFEALIAVLEEKDSDLAPLLQEDKPLSPSLAKALFEEASTSGGQGLFSKIAEWQAECKVGSYSYLFAQKLLEAILSQEAREDRSPGPEAQPVLAAVKEGCDGVRQLLVQVAKKAIAYSESPSASFETKQFLQTVLLPKIETWIAQDAHSEKGAEAPSRPAPLLQKPLASEGEKLEQAGFEPLPASAAKQENVVMQEIPNAGPFPVVGPYPSLFPPMDRHSKRRRRSTPRREEHLEEEEADEPRSDSTTP
jgi:hypothetical protein